MKYSKLSGTIEIFYSDLSESAKEEFLKIYGIKSPEEGNFDVVPVAVVGIDLSYGGGA